MKVALSSKLFIPVFHRFFCVDPCTLILQIPLSLRLQAFALSLQRLCAPLLLDSGLIRHGLGHRLGLRGATVSEAGGVGLLVVPLGGDTGTGQCRQYQSDDDEP